MSKTFVIGDIHGACRALRQCLDRSGFDTENDHLICLGDVCDGWPETRQSIDMLFKIRHLTYILGNHDLWALEWMRYDHLEDLWAAQGGKATMASYTGGIPAAHVRFLENALPYYLHDNRLFVHGGIDPQTPLEQQGYDIFLWDRVLANIALNAHTSQVDGQLTSYDEIYIGHTPIPNREPVRGCEIWLMDTGAGWSGVLSMMDIDSKEVFTSDPVPALYPGIEGRKRA